MAINLTKGSGINLEKQLEELMFTVSWDTNIDVDIHCLVLTDGKGACDEDFVFYNNLQHPSGAINHSGDIRDGSHAMDYTSVRLVTQKLKLLTKQQTQF